MIRGSVADNISGSAGNDVIDAKAGPLSTITGGDGDDTFVFTAAANGINVINVTDFQTGADQLHLANESMAALGVDGALDPLLFASYSSVNALFAAGAGGVLKYLTSAGQLFYDADGAGSGTPINQIMTLNLNGGFATLAASDITVI